MYCMDTVVFLCQYAVPVAQPPHAAMPGLPASQTYGSTIDYYEMRCQTILTSIHFLGKRIVLRGMFFFADSLTVCTTEMKIQNAWYRTITCTQYILTCPCGFLRLTLAVPLSILNLHVPATRRAQASSVSSRL